MALYFPRVTKEWFVKGIKGLNDNSIVTLLVLAAGADKNGWVGNVSIPALADTVGYNSRHIYNGMKELNNKEYIEWYGDDLRIPIFTERFKKFGQGSFLVPDVLLTRRFTFGLTLRAKRLTLWLLSMNIADKKNKLSKKGICVKKEKLVAVTGSDCTSFFEEKVLSQVKWLFNFNDQNDRYHITVKERYIVSPEIKLFADYINLANLKIMLARYKNLIPYLNLAWKDLIWLWTTFGSRLLHKALCEANKRKFIIKSLGAYLHKTIKNMLAIEKLKYSTVYI